MCCTFFCWCEFSTMASPRRYLGVLFLTNSNSASARYCGKQYQNLASNSCIAGTHIGLFFCYKSTQWKMQMQQRTANGKAWDRQPLWHLPRFAGSNPDRLTHAVEHYLACSMTISTDAALLRAYPQISRTGIQIFRQITSRACFKNGGTAVPLKSHARLLGTLKTLGYDLVKKRVSFVDSNYSAVCFIKKYQTSPIRYRRRLKPTTQVDGFAATRSHFAYRAHRPRGSGKR